MRIAYIDFETRSICNLKKQGTWNYAIHPSTSILCLAYAIDDGPVKLWHRGHVPTKIKESDPPEDLFSVVTDRRTLVEAHNVSFERVIWANTGFILGWPSILDSQLRCSAAKAARFNLPRSLDMVGYALNLPIQKDNEGHRLMLKLSQPRKPTKFDRSVWHEKPEELERLWKYCVNDVEVERLVSLRLPDPPPHELKIFQVDMAINDRGIVCDRALTAKASNIVAEEKTELSQELNTITQGDVFSSTNRDQFIQWVNEQGHTLSDTQGTTLDSILENNKVNLYGSELDSTTRRVIEVYRLANRTSNAKYDSMQQFCCPDGRIRGTLLYHGATPTGRWAGKGIQPHNFPRGKIKNMDQVCADILSQDLGSFRLLYGNVLQTLSWALRGALVAPHGYDLITADFKAIEARVTLWFGNEQKWLDVFRRDEDLYRYTAGTIYGVDWRTIGKNSDERQVGKAADLGLGFGMGDEKFYNKSIEDGIKMERAFATAIVSNWRDTHPGVVQFWWDCQNAVMLAIEHAGKIFKVGRVAFGCGNGFLFCRLPSGRQLAYYQPKIQMLDTPWGEKRLGITHMGVNDKHQYTRIKTYGGKLVENIVQATARDLMADAILRVEDTEIYRTVLSVHDEVIAEVPEGKGSLKEFQNIITELPTWADGLPVTAEGWRGKRYKK